MKAFFEEVLTRFEPISKPASYEKGALLQSAGTTCYNLFLVQSGALRSFYYVEERDVTAHFALEYGIVGAADSIIRGTQSRYCIEALESSVVIVLDYRSLESFLAQNPHLERLARQFTQYLYIDLVERLEERAFCTARERYTHLLKRHPDITQRLSLGHIASYLGITQETLSRVRAQR
jgi:CRP-like cAMP-binding protein